MTRVLTIVPARMASSRFPGKPLIPLLGVALVAHVFERCRLNPRAGRVVIATCDESIRVACEKMGAEVVMTSDTHPGCVDRTEEAVDKVGRDLDDNDLILMVQGDEVLFAPDMTDQIVDAYLKHKDPVINLASPIVTQEDHEDPNCVKVAFAESGRALYFSRAPIPFRGRAPGTAAWQQTGVIGFSKRYLRTFRRLPRTPHEMTEHIDMLRVIEHGHTVRIVTTDRETIGVDTPSDRDRAEQMLRRDRWTARYMSVSA